MTLQDIKAGDIVILNSIGIGANRTLLCIERVTKTLLITSRNRRFRKVDGYSAPRSSAFTSCWVSVPKEGEVAEVRADLRHHLLVRRINTACEMGRLRCLPLEALERIRQALEENDAN